MLFTQLTDIQKNILIASIIADGEITKLYKNSRRKNNNYREHFGEMQKSYRIWKANFFDGFLYLRQNSNYLVSKSDNLFTNLYNFFYNNEGKKRIPHELLQYCTLPHFLSILYLDDGSLCISKRINKQKKLIYLTPHIYLYLQNYPLNELKILKEHISKIFGFNFCLSKRKDGFGYILKFTKVNDTLRFLCFIKSTVEDCREMEYKFNWFTRLSFERKKLLMEYPGYEILSSDSGRWRNYEDEEIKKIIYLKRNGTKDNDIAAELNRSYWSIVYKIQSLRKDGLL
ncbi:DNA endonuclease [Neobacillus sp. PS3-34]|uniref:DNA endonuclease n=1 Tax=Neobacillus sp. PS3-34 TaxID=3070678 RepID=UPI0027E1F3B6|nr:DNA endonuclease [Neobacillus sp. PS3-34]WML46890.1 DNA endonuclease [Neobacillus sp. PS3-34]